MEVILPRVKPEHLALKPKKIKPFCVKNLMNIIYSYFIYMYYISFSILLTSMP